VRKNRNVTDIGKTNRHFGAHTTAMNWMVSVHCAV